MDEVSLKLKAVSEALTLLEDAAILPSLYRLLEAAQAEVDLRPEARAKAIAADRIERVSGLSVHVRPGLLKRPNSSFFCNVFTCSPGVTLDNLRIICLLKSYRQ